MRFLRWLLVIVMAAGLCLLGTITVRRAMELPTGWRGPTPWLAAGVMLALSVAVCLTWAVPRLMVHGSFARPATTPEEALEAENHGRANLVGIIGGLAVIGGLFFTLWQFHETQALTEQQALTSDQKARSERFSAAIVLLPNKKTEVPAIYSLNQVAADAEEYRLPVVNSLTAFVNERAAREAEAGGGYVQVPSENEPLRTRTPGAQVVLEVLGSANSDWTSGPSGEQPYTKHVNLFGADLRLADLTGRDLRRVRLTGVDLTGCTGNAATQLSGAVVKTTLLIDCHLRNANLERVLLNDVSLNGAKLKGANMNRATLMNIECNGATEWPTKKYLTDYNKKHKKPVKCSK